MKDLSETVTDIVSAVLLLTGAVFCLLGALGLLRFPDTVSRLHASSKAQTLGVLLALLGAAVHVPLPYAGLLLLTGLFQLFTAPVTGQVVGRVAYRTGAVDHRTLFTDELVGQLAPPNPPDTENGDDGNGNGNGGDDGGGNGTGRRRER